MDRLGTGAGVLLTSLKENDNTRTGKTSTADFEGSFDECTAKRDYLISIGASETDLHSVGNGYWRVTANFQYGFDGTTTSFPDVPSVHELEVNTIQTSVYRSNKVRLCLTPLQIGVVQRVVSDYQSGSTYPLLDGNTAEADAESDLQSKIVSPWANGRDSTKAKADALSLFRAVAYLGIEDFIEYTNVYRRTLTAATPNQVRAAYTGVGKIWTTAEVESWEGINPTGWFILDKDRQWLKSRPQVNAVAGQKIQIVYSYTECLIAFGLTYDAYKSASLLYPPST